MAAFKVAFGSSAYTSEIVQKTLSLRELFKLFKKPQIRNKKDGPYIILASFKQGATRNASSLTAYYGAMVDLDDTDLTIKQIRREFKDHPHAIYTTHSHKDPEKGDRYRLVIPYSEPADKAKHAEVIMMLMSRLGIDNVDLSSKAISRPMYLPAAPRSRAEHCEYYQNRKGELLDPYSLELSGDALWQYQELMREELEKVDLQAEVEDGNRNNELARRMGRLINDGMSFQDCLNYLYEINQIRCKPPLSNRDVKTIAKSVWQSHSRNHNDTDWGFQQIQERLENIDKGAMANEAEHFVDIIADSMKRGKTTRTQADVLLQKIKEKAPSISIGSLREDIKDRQKGKRRQSDEAETTADEDLDQLYDEIRDEFKDYYFIAPENMIFNARTNTPFKMDGFNNANISLKFDTGLTDLTPYRILEQASAITMVDGRRYHPGKQRLFKDEYGARFVNTYNPVTFYPERGSVIPMLRHMAYLFPDQHECDIVLDFIAYLVQYPGEKIRWAPIIKGPKQVGKSLIVNEIITPILGLSNIKPYKDASVLQRDFNSWQTDSQLTVFHEVYLSSRLETKKIITEGLKSFITDPYQMINQKFEREYQAENVTNLFGLTNHEGAIYITPDETRFCMLKIEASRKSNNYYRNLMHWLKNNKAQMLSYFLRRKIRAIEPEVRPYTAYTEELINDSFNWAESLLRDNLKDRKSELMQFKAWTWEQLTEYLLTQIPDTSLLKYEEVRDGSSGRARQLKDALTETGFKQWKSITGDTRINVDGGKTRVWVTPRGVNGRLHKANSKNIRKEIDKIPTSLQREFA